MKNFGRTAFITATDDAIDACKGGDPGASLSLKQAGE